MPRTNFLADQRKRITSRLDELRPLYDEYLTLEKAQQALEQLDGTVRRRGPGGPPGKRGPGRPPGSGKRRGRPAGSKTTRRTTTRRRSGGGGTRAEEALKAITQSPGITIPELADKLNIRPNYLYRVTAQLQRERRIRRRNRGFHPAK